MSSLNIGSITEEKKKKSLVSNFCKVMEVGSSDHIEI